MTGCKTVRSLGGNHTDNVGAGGGGGCGRVQGRKNLGVNGAGDLQNKVGHLGRGNNVRDTSSLYFSPVVQVQLGKVDE